MADPFLGQITLFASNFAPRSWAFCDGQLLSIPSNSALFSLLGTIYGGDGRTTFALPDLRGRVPIHAGNGPGLTSRQLGSKGGAESTVLGVLNLPSHSHTVTIHCKLDDGDSDEPDDKMPAKGGNGESIYSSSGTTADMNAAMATAGNTGSGQSFNNMPPFLAINFIIALQGIFPSRS